jgi:hypothetical protein
MSNKNTLRGTVFVLFVGILITGIGSYWTDQEDKKIPYLKGDIGLTGYRNKDLEFSGHQFRKKHPGTQSSQKFISKAIKRSSSSIQIGSDSRLKIRDIVWAFTILTSIVTSIICSFLLLLGLLTFNLRLFQIQRLLRNGCKGYLGCYFPEEAVGELIALRRELTHTKKSRIVIEITLLYVVFTLIWAFYIQINIENLWLPSKDQRRR